MRRTGLFLIVALLVAVPTLAQAPQTAKPKLSEFTKWTKAGARDWAFEAEKWERRAFGLLTETESGLHLTKEERDARRDHIAALRDCCITLAELLGECMFEDGSQSVKTFVQVFWLQGLIAEGLDNVAELIEDRQPSLALEMQQHATAGIKLNTRAADHADGLLDWAEKVAGKAEW